MDYKELVAVVIRLAQRVRGVFGKVKSHIIGGDPTGGVAVDGKRRGISRCQPGAGTSLRDDIMSNRLL